VSSYPTRWEDANLLRIGTLRDSFGVPVGFSDHTPSVETGALAVAAGAHVLEKHLTLDVRLPGPDQALSLEPEGLAAYIAAVRHAEEALGDGELGMREVEREVRRIARKSVVAAVDIPAGQVLRPDSLTLKRPAGGIEPDGLERLMATRQGFDTRRHPTDVGDGRVRALRRSKARRRRRVAVVTGTRAEYGLLASPMRAIAAHPRLQLQLVVCGMHLLKKFGHTLDDIVRDGCEWMRGCGCSRDRTTPATRRPGWLAACRVLPAFWSGPAAMSSWFSATGSKRSPAAVAGYTTGRIVAHIHGGDVSPAIWTKGFATESQSSRTSIWPRRATPLSGSSGWVNGRSMCTSLALRAWTTAGTAAARTRRRERSNVALVVASPLRPVRRSGAPHDDGYPADRAGGGPECGVLYPNSDRGTPAFWTPSGSRQGSGRGIAASGALAAGTSI